MINENCDTVTMILQVKNDVQMTGVYFVKQK